MEEQAQGFSLYRDFFRVLAPSLFPEKPPLLVVWIGAPLLILMLVAFGDEHPEATAVVAGVVLVWWALKFAAKRNREAEAEKQRQQVVGLVQDACAYIHQVNTSRSFPAVWMKTVNAKPGEFGLLHETTTLFEHKDKRYTLGAGTRLRVGKIPIYLGGAQHFSHEQLEAVAGGDLYLTNGRVVFVSDRKAVTVPLSDLIAVNADPSAIVLHSAQRDKPYIFRVGNSALWTLLLKLFAQGLLKAQSLPEGVTVTAKAATTPGEVELEISSPKPLAVAP
jgi:hypothetical protein